jgi:phosphomannomutase
MEVETFNTVNVLTKSDVVFGTSGARGLVTDFTPEVCAAFSHTFITVMQADFEFKTLAIAIDNRPSSVTMAKACAAAAQQRGIEVNYYGVVPTPALAYVAMQKNIPSIMVTGSHIPFDRNGLKFYRPDGEITKQDEQAILTTSVDFLPLGEPVSLAIKSEAADLYISRYTSLFTDKPLANKRIGIYEHSSAGRDLYPRIFEALGADVISLERTNTFVSIDTEAVAEEDREKARNWSQQYQFDAIFSTDGDGDRPLLSDEHGEWLRGDILGLLCSQILNIEALAVPVSCNSIIEPRGTIKQVTRTKIGSPYVIAEFAGLNQTFSSVAGFEANGGFLLGSDVTLNSQVIKALPTRDAILPVLMVLFAAKETTISALVNALPQRITHSDRIKNFATAKSQALIESAKKEPQNFINQLGFETFTIQSVDITDGLRLILNNQDVIHLRPSGNAPELRCYAESSNIDTAFKIVTKTLQNTKLLAESIDK